MKVMQYGFNYSQDSLEEQYIWQRECNGVQKQQDGWQE